MLKRIQVLEEGRVLTEGSKELEGRRTKEKDYKERIQKVVE